MAAFGLKGSILRGSVGGIKVDTSTADEKREFSPGDSEMPHRESVNREALTNLATLLAEHPLRMTSVEEAERLVKKIGVYVRIACDVRLHSRRIHVVASPDASPAMTVRFPRSDVHVPLYQICEDEWEGAFQYPWDDYFLLISHNQNTARAHIYGACAAALANHFMRDESIPVVGIWALGAGVAEVLEIARLSVESSDPRVTHFTTPFSV